MARKSRESSPHKADRSTPAEIDEAGNIKPSQPSVDEQSGSTGRPTPDPENPGKDTGQGRYGQTGYSGGQPGETISQTRYKESETKGDPRSKQDSNRGSGSVDQAPEHARKQTHPPEANSREKGS